MVRPPEVILVSEESEVISVLAPEWEGVVTVQSGSVGKQSGLRVSPGAYLGAAWAVLMLTKEKRRKLMRKMLVPVFIRERGMERKMWGLMVMI
jgi:hypothetical protein